ncbi:hypothetical protein ACFV42_23360 [Streptomyces solisilvae]|uniref:hypothetical protein n=1 Tax=Streptomyces malaysiensis TaxID=92644 RepID=UPI0036C63CEA
MAYGDDDATGDPTRLCEALESILSEHGIAARISQLNSYDLQMAFTGHGAARLLYLLVEKEMPSPKTEEELVRMMVDGIG